MQDSIQNALRQVIDPELGINIVDLGLVYAAVQEDCQLRVTLTLTTPSCPLGPYIKDQVFRQLWKAFPKSKAIRVEMVWDPPWGPHCMSEAARQQLGWPATKKS